MNESISLKTYTTCCIILTTIVYVASLVWYPEIHKETLANVTSIVPWLRTHINLGEGRELGIYTLITGLYCALLITLYHKSSWFRQYIPSFEKSEMFQRYKKILVNIALVVIGILVLLKTRIFLDILSNTIKKNSIEVVLLLTTIVGITLASTRLFAIPKQEKVQPNKIKLLVQLLFLTLCTTLVLIFNYYTSIIDFDFVIAPSLKLHQHASLNTFYMQYNLLSTLLGQIIITLHLTLNQISLLLTLLYILWIPLYYRASKLLLKDQFLTIIATLTIFIVRYFSHVLIIIQSTPIRPDLWIPAIIIATTYGLFSLQSATIFAILYALDNHFGFMYATAFWTLYIINKRRELFTIKTIQTLIPFIGALIINLILFKSPVSVGALLYRDIKIDFIPISKVSVFWIILFILGMYIFTTLKQPNTTKQLRLMLLCIALIQLTYFFGRSPENNLFNISSILILIAFMTAKDLSSVIPISKKAYRLLYLLPTLAACILMHTLINRLSYAKIALTHRSLTNTHPLDAIINKYPNPFPTDKNKVLIIGMYDGYLNYRYTIHQQGYFAPFWANVYAEDTAQFLYTKAAQDYVLYFLKDNLDGMRVYFDHNFEPDIYAMNTTKYLQQKNAKLSVQHLDSSPFNKVIVEVDKENK